MYMRYNNKIVPDKQTEKLYKIIIWLPKMRHPEAITIAAEIILV